MNQRSFHVIERLRASFWLVPSLMVVLAVVLAQLLLRLERRIDPSEIPGLAWLTLGDPDSARSLLSAIAASMITVAGTVFSITIVALGLASSQFGTRLVRNFMRDRGTQLALGIFLSDFVYALMILRGINAKPGVDDSHDIAVHLAVLLALVSIATFIYFIHNVAQSIQVDNITFWINQEFSDALDRHYPGKASTPAERLAAGADFRDRDALDLGDEVLKVCGGAGGYVLSIDNAKLIDWAREHDCCVVLDCHPGKYVHHWSRVARIYPPPRAVDRDEARATVGRAINTGHLPTPEQDVVYSIHQLSQIAVRALSPGINDPYTAYSCIDRLVDGLGKVLQRPQRPNCFRDQDAQLRLVTKALDFGDLLHAAFDEIREYGRGSGTVMRHLLHDLTELARVCERDADRRAFYDYSRRLEEDCREFLEDRHDRQTLDKQIQTIRTMVAASSTIAGS